MATKYKKIHLASFFGTLILLVSILNVGLASKVAYADYPPINGQCNPGDTKETNEDDEEVCRESGQSEGPAGAEQGTTDGEDDGITCTIEKVGWMLCPVIESAGKIGDQAFQFLAKNFLETEPELVADNSGTKYAWDLARNIANILFIIAFLVIIYSQVTGAGISNYGIKRMMPRLIIAALAVNTSYYICQGMVDLTNILGYEIQNFMIDTAREVTTSAAMPPAQKGFMDNQTSNGVLGTIATGALGLSIAWAILPVLLLGIGTVVITCLVIIIILLLRKAFIVLLVVIAPVAFVAYLLPNTERYFQKWLNMFWQLLLVFPVVALLFGAGQLASAVILVAGMNEPFYQGGEKCVLLPQGDATEATLTDCAGGAVAAEERAGTDENGPVQSGRATPFMLGLVAAGIAVAPLLAVWAVLKGALSAAGALGGKISGAVQSTGNRGAGRAKKAEDALRKSAGRAVGQEIATRALSGRFGSKAQGIAGVIRRRKLSGDRRKAALEAAQAGYDLGDDRAQTIVQDTIAAKQAVSAAQMQQSLNYAKEGALKPETAGQYLGAAGAVAAAGALGSQQTKAMAEAIKDAELSLDTSDLNGLESALVNATRDGNQIMERAISNALLKSGSKGQESFHNAIRILENEGRQTGNIRSNVVQNHPGIKDSDASISSWATGTGTLESHRTSGGTWAGLSAAKFSGLSRQAQEAAATALSPQDLQRIANDLRASPESLAKVDPGTRGRLGL